MKFEELEKRKTARESGVPEMYLDREVIKTEELRAPFENDAPIVLIKKPKLTQVKGGKYERVYSERTGNAVFKTVAFIPVLFDDRRCIVCTGVEETLSIIRGLFEDVEPQLVFGVDLDDEDRIEMSVAEELIEGKLRFVLKPKKYANGKTHDVSVLDMVHSVLDM